MALARPELIFVRGPQDGERAVLMTNPVVVGRSAVADVRLKENASSREQLRFDLTPEGWLMQNLSANGTLINGKRYRGGKRLLLDTGDILGVGAETEILYVAPPDVFSSVPFTRIRRPKWPLDPDAFADLEAAGLIPLGGARGDT